MGIFKKILFSVHAFTSFRLHWRLRSIKLVTFRRTGLKRPQLSCSPRHTSCQAVQWLSFPYPDSAPAATGELQLMAFISAAKRLCYFALGVLQQPHDSDSFHESSAKMPIYIFIMSLNPLVLRLLVDRKITICQIINCTNFSGEIYRTDCFTLNCTPHPLNSLALSHLFNAATHLSIITAASIQQLIPVHKEQLHWRWTWLSTGWTKFMLQPWRWDLAVTLFLFVFIFRGSILSLCILWMSDFLSAFLRGK